MAPTRQWLSSLEFLTPVFEAVYSPAVQAVLTYPVPPPRLSGGASNSWIMAEYRKQRAEAYRDVLLDKHGKDNPALPYRELVDSLQEIEQLRAERATSLKEHTAPAQEEEAQKKYNAEIHYLLALVEWDICTMVRKHRALLEDPLILAYWRASSMARNDQFFWNLGRALQGKTTDHAHRQKWKAYNIAYHLDQGIPLEKIDTDGNVMAKGSKAEPINPTAVNKLFQRHKVRMREKKVPKQRAISTIKRFIKERPELNEEHQALSEEKRKGEEKRLRDELKEYWVNTRPTKKKPAKAAKRQRKVDTKM
jgi:hypothetical protein